MKLDLTHIQEIGFLDRRNKEMQAGLSIEAASILAATQQLNEIHFMLRLWMRSRGLEPGTVVEFGPDERDRP